MALDMDDDYLRLAAAAQSQIGFIGLSTTNPNVMDWYEPADIVIALALIREHLKRQYSCVMKDERAVVFELGSGNIKAGCVA